jgi:hypothetical protein
MGLGRARPRRRELRHLERQAWGRKQRRRAWVLGGAVAIEVVRMAIGILERGAIVAGVLAVVVVAVPPLRWRARAFVSGLWARRRFMASARHAGVVNTHNRVPTPVRIRPVPVGHVVRVRMVAGGHAGQLEAAAPAMAASLGVREVRVTRDRDNAKYADVVVVRRDPLAGSVPLAWPLVDVPRFSVWDRIPVGVGEDGQGVRLGLPYRHLLVGGESGGGKSVVLSMLIATAALDPSVLLYLIDGKHVEHAFWRERADALVGPNVDEAIDVMKAVGAEMDRRYELLLDQRRRKIVAGDGLPLYFVFVDELAVFTDSGESREAKNASKEFNNRTMDLARRGRAAGVVLVAATQRPSADIVPSSLRSLVPLRWALRCGAPEDSDTILGRRWASRGWSTDTEDAGNPGVGLLRAEGRTPVRLRAYCLADEDLEAMAARAVALRAPALALPEEGSPSVLGPLPQRGVA